LAAGAVCAAEVEGQERARPSAGATVQASATILPSIDAATFSSLSGDVRIAVDTFTRRSTSIVATTRAPESATTIGRFYVDPPVARSFARLDGALRHTIAVLY
jgi:hypothetical protein